MPADPPFGVSAGATAPVVLVIPGGTQAPHTTRPGTTPAGHPPQHTTLPYTGAPIVVLLVLTALLLAAGTLLRRLAA